MPKKTNSRPAGRADEKLSSDSFEKKISEYEPSPKIRALRIMLIYLLIGILWILLSDKLVGFFIKERAIIIGVSILKGWFYVIISSMVIFSLVLTAMKKVTDSKDKIEKLNDELEKKVSERTTQLEKTNAELEETNAILEEEIVERQNNERKIKDLNDELENRVSERTNQLQDMNTILEEEIHEKTLIESELNREKVFIEAIFNSVSGMIYLYDDQNKLVRWNKKHNEITGYSSEELEGMSLMDWYRDDKKSQEAVLKGIESTINNGFGEVEAFLRKKDGTTIPMYFTASPVKIENRLYFAGIGIDITELKRTNERLQKYKILAEKANDAMLFIDIQGNILEANDAAVKIYGYTYKEFSSMSIFDLRHLEKPSGILEQIEVADKKGIIFETVHYLKDGTPIQVEVSSQGTYLGDKRVLLSIVRNITKRKKAEEEVLYLSYHDQLTGLYNRRFYEEELRRLDTERNLPIALVMGDVNGLKLTNDAFGHQAGDILIKKIANILKKECRADDILSRIGGDEFILILPKTDTFEVEKIVQRINSSIGNKKIDNMILSVSFGWGIKKQINEEITKAYIQAEDHMYRNKLFESKSMKSKTINLITKSLYEKNELEHQHCQRVSEICKEIATSLEFSPDEVIELGITGLLHDIGKIGITEKILNKPEKLNETEWLEVKRHPEIGYQILRSVNEFSNIAEYTLAHHERIDGKGYPRGLKGNELSVQTKILAIAEAYDSMTSVRPYSKALSEEEALIEIINNSGTQFDTEISRAFIEKVLCKQWNYQKE